MCITRNFVLIITIKQNHHKKKTIKNKAFSSISSDLHAAYELRTNAEDINISNANIRCCFRVV